SAPLRQKSEDRIDELSDLLDDLSGSAAPLDLDLPELRTQAPADEKKRDGRAIAAGSDQAAATMPRPPRHNRASDLRIDSAIATRAAELLLRPPDASAEANTPAAVPVP